MKVAIVTQPLAYNIGGILQNYALQQVLKRLGHTPITFDQASGYVPHWKLIRHNLLQFLKILPKDTSPNPSIDNFVSTNICATPKARFISDFRRFDRKYKPQAYIVGSDQVWRGDFNIFPQANFLSFTNSDRKLAYAASFGVDYWTFDGELTPTLVANAQQFRAISVREDSGIKLCNEILKRDAVHVLDPTMLLNKEDYTRLTQHCAMTENVLATYILDMNNEKKAAIRAIMSDSGLKELPLCNAVENQIQTRVSVEQWLAAFRDAKVVVCDSFHGTVFSIIYEKPFFVLANNARGNTRLKSLLEVFGLRDRFIEDASLFTPPTIC